MLTSTELTLNQFFTHSTCGEACWEAREDTCHCSCGGRNHGILRNGGEHPERNCKIDGKRYILAGFSTDYNEAQDSARKLMDELTPGLCSWAYGDQYRDEKNMPILVRKAGKSQLNWLEVQNLDPVYLDLGMVYFIWRLPAGEKYITKGSSHSNDYTVKYPAEYAIVK